MPRSPETATGLKVRKRDGRIVAFDAERLFGSIRRALQSSGAEDLAVADDLGSVVVTFIESQQDKAVVATGEIGELVRQVLANAGWENGAFMFERVRRERDRVGHGLRIRAGRGEARPAAADGPSSSAPAAWTKGRVVELLRGEAMVPDEAAHRVAAEVERGLFASGLRSVSEGLLREWIDNELDLAGLSARLGHRRALAVNGHEVRGRLAGCAPGVPAEQLAAATVLEPLALRETYPPAVARAHEQGLLHLGGLGGAGRLHAVRLPASVLSDDPAAAGLALRQVAEVCSGEVAVVWDRPAPVPARARAWLLGAAASHLGGPRVVLCVPVDEDAGAGAEVWLAARADLQSATVGRASRRSAVRLPTVRLCGAAGDRLARAVQLERADDGFEVAAVPPPPGVVDGDVTLNLARLALASRAGARPSTVAVSSSAGAGRRGPKAGPVGVTSVGERLDRALGLAVTALSARRTLAGSAPRALACVARALGRDPIDLGAPVDRIAFAGLHEAAALLPHAGRPDLAALLVVVVASLRAAVGLQGTAVEIGLADAPARRRFGQLDRRAHRSAAALVPSTADRDGFRYDGPVVIGPDDDAGQLGRARALAAATLGMAPWLPAPRSTGGASQRAEFVRAWMEHLSARGETSRCA